MDKFANSGEEAKAKSEAYNRAKGSWADKVIKAQYGVGVEETHEVEHEDLESPDDLVMEPKGDPSLAEDIVAKINQELDESLDIFRECLQSGSKNRYDEIMKGTSTAMSLIQGLNAAFEAECNKLEEVE